MTSLSDGRYDRVTKDYYATFRALTEGTRFAALAAFYHQRDERIIANVLATAKQHPGKRIVIVTGADHHGARSSARLPGTRVWYRCCRLCAEPSCAGWRVNTQWMWTPPVAAMRADPRFMPICVSIGLNDYWKKRSVTPDFLSLGA